MLTRGKSACSSKNSVSTVTPFLAVAWKSSLEGLVDGGCGGAHVAMLSSPRLLESAKANASVRGLRPRLFCERVTVLLCYGANSPRHIQFLVQTQRVVACGSPPWIGAAAKRGRSSVLVALFVTLIRHHLTITRRPTLEPSSLRTDRWISPSCLVLVTCSVLHSYCSKLVLF